MSKTIYEFESPFDRTKVTVQIAKYGNNRNAIQLTEADTGFPYMTCTVNMPHVTLNSFEVLIKDYSENEGVLKFLVDNNIVTDTGRGEVSGFVVLPICILNDPKEWRKPC